MISLLLTSALLLSPPERAALYKAIDPYNVNQLCAYHELFADTAEGQQALQRAMTLLGGQIGQSSFNSGDLHELVEFVAFRKGSGASLDESTLQWVEKLGARLGNRTLKGRSVTTLEEVVALEPHEVDIGRATAIAQGDGKIRELEATLDLLALRALAKLQPYGGLNASDQRKINAINEVLYFELSLRYPPLSDKEKYGYSSVSQILDSRKGICMGTSLLYLCIGQRLNLELEAVTPPGHIYVRTKEINIETTARGINVAGRNYESIHTKGLKVRTRKEALGCLFGNQAFELVRDARFEEAAAQLEKAVLFMPDDEVMLQMLGLCRILSGQEGKSKIEQSLALPTDVEIDHLTVGEDYLRGNVDKEAIKAYLLPYEPKKSALLQKRAAMTKALKRCPRFRDGWLQLAEINHGLNRPQEATDALLRYHALDAGSVMVECSLAELLIDRLQYSAARTHLLRAQEILQQAGVHKSRQWHMLWTQLQSYDSSPTEKSYGS